MSENLSFCEKFDLNRIIDFNIDIDIDIDIDYCSLLNKYQYSYLTFQKNNIFTYYIKNTIKSLS